MSKAIQSYLTTNQNLPEHLINQLIQARLKKPDCAINGWVLEGFPLNQSQINLLAAMRIRPNVVIQINQKPEKAAERYSKKKIDPQTGKAYNLAIELVKDMEIKERLVKADQDNQQYISNGFDYFNTNLTHLEDFFGDDIETVDAFNMTVEETTDYLSDIVFKRHLKIQ